MMAAIAPWPAGTASCIARAAEVHETNRVLQRERAGRDQRAVLSKRVPGSERRFGRLGAASRSAARAAMLVVTIAGCVLAVRVSSLSGPSKHNFGDRPAERRVGALEDVASCRGGVVQGLAHADGLRSLSGEEPGDSHGPFVHATPPAWKPGVYIRTSALAQEMPAPSAHISTVWPGLMRPSRTPSSSAIGMEALEVLP